ncbi:MAG TPA: hypothetical protein VIG06_15660 [Kofleriaceae bacterium]|jgi:hypothetical protein
MSPARIHLSWLLAAAALSACATGSSSSPEAPAAVREAADRLVGPRASLHREGSIYEAAGKTTLEVELAADGSLREVEVALPLAALPAAVRAAVMAKLEKGATIRESELIVTPEGVVFEVEAKLPSGKEVELAFDQSGSAVSQEDDEGDDDDDDGK